MLGRLKSSYINYLARLYIIDSSGNATPTTTCGFSDELIQLNGLPIGDYAFVITSNNDTYNNSYSFDINATNPAANLNDAIFLSRDLSIFMYENSVGDIYGNGKEIYNTYTKTGSNLEWTRYEYLGLDGGFQQRTHSVKRPVIKGMSFPATYSSATASSDCVVFLYCDINTSFSHMFSYYMSAPDPIHFGDVKDTTGRVTPRSLDELDFSGGNEHVLVFDLNTGKTIDFYSSLNLYYAGGYEAPPSYEFYN